MLFIGCSKFHRYNYFEPSEKRELVQPRERDNKIIGEEKQLRDGERRKECEHRGCECAQRKRSRRRQSVISLVIDHHTTHVIRHEDPGFVPVAADDWPGTSVRKLSLSLFLSRCGVQCLSVGMIYRNDALFFGGSDFPADTMTRCPQKCIHATTILKLATAVRHDVSAGCFHHMDATWANSALVIKIRFSKRALGALFYRQNETSDPSC